MNQPAIQTVTLATERSGHIATAGSPASKQLGAYRVIAKLGRGGMGTVYKAIHRELGSLVALKVITERHTGDARIVKHH